MTQSVEYLTRDLSFSLDLTVVRSRPMLGVKPTLKKKKMHLLGHFPSMPYEEPKISTQ